MVERLLVITSVGSCVVLAGPEGGAEKVQALIADTQIKMFTWLSGTGIDALFNGMTNAMSGH